ncbi:hypothetical protein V500_05989 [Pseudogymnoascus sp. VKM F-4518 (FW-2643)]|nr:hypothetical protein V500_05989 [Pseudogymnoascus sp. VKM F-4518 (FW-2643)]
MQRGYTEGTTEGTYEGTKSGTTVWSVARVARGIVQRMDESIESTSAVQRDDSDETVTKVYIQQSPAPKQPNDKSPPSPPLCPAPAQHTPRTSQWYDEDWTRPYS